MKFQAVKLQAIELHSSQIQTDLLDQIKDNYHLDPECQRLLQHSEARQQSDITLRDGVSPLQRSKLDLCSKHSVNKTNTASRSRSSLFPHFLSRWHQQDSRTSKSKLLFPTDEQRSSRLRFPLFNLSN